jgi:DNA repair protein RadC
LTQALKQALAMIDTNVLDHFIVTGSSVLSFAERQLL